MHDDELVLRVAKAIRSVPPKVLSREFSIVAARAAIAVIEAYGNELIDDLLADKLPSLSQKKSNH